MGKVRTAIGMSGWLVAIALGAVLLMRTSPSKTPATPEVTVDVTGLNSAEKFTTELSSQLKRPVVIVGRVLEEWDEVKFDVPKGTLAEVLQYARYDPIFRPDPIESRENGRVLEVGLRRDLEKRDARTESYDISRALERVYGTTEDPNQARGRNIKLWVTGTVEPNEWYENGGDLYESWFEGTRLMIKAPPRVHELVKEALRKIETTANSSKLFGG